jgi:hypothetical protein
VRLWSLPASEMNIFSEPPAVSLGDGNHVWHSRQGISGSQSLCTKDIRNTRLHIFYPCRTTGTLCADAKKAIS